MSLKSFVESSPKGNWHWSIIQTRTPTTQKRQRSSKRSTMPTPSFTTTPKDRYTTSTAPWASTSQTSSERTALNTTSSWTSAGLRWVLCLDANLSMLFAFSYSCMHMIIIILFFFFFVQTLLTLGTIFTCCCCFCCCCFCCGKCGGSEHEEDFHYVDPEELAAEMAEEQNGGEE